MVHPKKVLSAKIDAVEHQSYQKLTRKRGQNQRAEKLGSILLK